MRLYFSGILSAFIIPCVFLMPVQAQHKSWRQYTTDDGLPSNRVYNIMQDRQGYLWCSTDQGICRFNGYEFVRPIDTSAFAGNESFFPTEDNEGRIWFARLDASIWFIENNIVTPWKYNKVVDLYRDRFNIIDQLALGEDGSVWLSLIGIGFLVIDLNGGHRVIRGSDNANITFSRVGNKIIAANQAYRVIVSPPYEMDVLWHEDGNFQKLDRFINVDGNTLNGSGSLLSDGDHLLTYNNEITNINALDHQIKFNKTLGIITEKTIELDNGSFALASNNGFKHGLFYYSSIDDLQNEKGSNLLPRDRVTDFLLDREKGWWVATLQRGILYCKNPLMDTYDATSGFSSSNVFRLVDDRKEYVFASLMPKEIIKIHSTNNQEFESIYPAKPDQETEALFYHEGRIWSSPYLAFLENNIWQQLFVTINPIQRIPAKDFSKDPSSHDFWISSTTGFYKISNSDLSLTHFKESDAYNFTSRRTFSVTPDRNGTLWVATIDGLKVWKHDHYDVPPFNHPALKFQARDIELLPDGSVVFGFRGGGVLIMDPERRLKHISEREGLRSDFVTKLYSDLQGNVYVCTNFGLNKLSKTDGESWKVSSISTKQGLPSNLINDVTVLNDEFWIATSKGLAHLKEIPEPYPVSTPVLEKFLVNNQDTIFSEGMRLPHDQNNITIGFHSLHFRSEGNILYRYRLPVRDTIYTITKTRQVNFADLSPGSYNLEVQAQNEDGQWAEKAVWSFTILRPWWKTWVFVSIMIALGVVGILLSMNWRMRSVRNSALTANKIKDLELAALRAQINPHFIFNCLGSIQQFIVENDKASATRYLARFAKLVRLSLHSSVDGRHTLKEEVDMLDNYLALEQMRFKDKFTYTIQVDPDINDEEIFLPPMLVQPFVENAVIHGRPLSGEGMIVIKFRQEEKMLHVLVMDNGPGISDKPEVIEKLRKSFGMSLTRRRLKLLSHALDAESFKMENRTNSDGGILGTMIVIRVPIA